jgi:hypothetical protein
MQNEIPIFQGMLKICILYYLLTDVTEIFIYVQVIYFA